MENNDILRRIRYVFDFKDNDMVDIFKLADYSATPLEVTSWLKKEDKEGFEEISDKQLATFLNGLIIKNRGKKEGPQPVPEETLNNNLILRKLKIALSLRDEDILELIGLAGSRISKHEINAFFRKPSHMHYRQCKNQFLRNFLQGLQIKYDNKK